MSAARGCLLLCVLGTGSTAMLFGPTTPISGSRTDSDWTPSVKLQYQINPDAMTYASYSKGFKSGGFNALSSVPVAAVPFDPEFVNAYEIGIKSEWFDRTLRTNVTFFRSDYTDLQVANFVFDPVVCNGSPTGCMIVTNAAASRSQGIELETQWVPGEHFSFSANLSYLDAYYTDYKGAPANAFQTVRGLATQDLSGRPTVFAPKWSGSVTPSYTTGIGGLRITTSVTPYYSSSYFMQGDLNPLTAQSSYLRLDARISVEALEGRWGIDLIGKNLTDRNIKVVSSDFVSRGSVYAAKEEPANVALQARYRW